MRLTQDDQNKAEWHKKSSEKLKDPNFGIYGESYFREMLCMERKRSERSKRPFLLMLVDFEKIGFNHQRGRTVGDVIEVVLRTTRETDLKGWYQHDSIVGVIFSELGDDNAINSSEAVDSISSKFMSCLAKVLRPETLGQVNITFHAFPEQRHPGSSREPDAMLYPPSNGANKSQGFSIFLKKTIDIIGSLLAIVLFAPFFVLIAAAIKLTSKGPILFRQERVGQFGRKFTFLKFRSMYVNNDASLHKRYIEKFIKEKASYTSCDNGAKQQAVYKISDDPRVTRVGRFIRKTSLDELPQFFNVLKGDMSLVGPRPPIPYELESYDVWHRNRILEVKPGITGLWQISGRSSCTFDEMVRLDLRYSRNWSVLMDLRILLLTPWVVITSKGGY
ncbi:MAG: exopolysaccharide biosynthesis polyprenyl glycosylphosphotransferase [Desulforhabdus sp.]|nr:exopolysaccharide biosynthesis polyprenyl glycosylphosphotransferase [Desulforhabdus sp.]